MYKARIVIADGNANDRKHLKDLLTKAGYAVMNEAPDGLKALKAIQQLTPELVILDTDLGVYSGTYVAKVAAETDQVPVILTSSSTQHDIFREAAESLAFAHLIKPIDEANLYASIEIALANYRRVLELKNEIEKLQKDIRSRKLVEKAKGLLMKHQNLTEEEAYKKIRSESMNRHLSMARIADSIIAFYRIQD